MDKSITKRPCITFLPEPPARFFSPPPHLFLIQVDEQGGGEMKTSKDLSSTSEAEQITSPTAPDRQSSLAIRLDRNTAAFEKERNREGKTGSDFIPRASKAPVFTSGLRSHAVSGSPNTSPKPRDARDRTLLDDGRL